MRIGKVISGGQTGADQGALRAARTVGVPTGGYAPKGWTTEDGPAPWLADFGLTEIVSGNYAARTRMNVQAADMTLIVLGSERDLFGGTLLTQRFCLERVRESGKPFCVIDMSRAVGRMNGVMAIAESLPAGGTLNVAGPRETKSPGIGAAVEEWLTTVFKAAL